MSAPPEALERLWRAVGLDPTRLPPIALEGTDHALPSSFAVTRLARLSLALAGAGAAAVHAARGGPESRVCVDGAHAAAEFRSERHLHLDGAPPGDLWDPIAGLYATVDGHLRVHTNFPHHRRALVTLLGCADDREAVARALKTRRATEVEAAAAAAGAVAAALRSFDSWDASAPGAAAASAPVVAVERIGDAPGTPLPPAPAGRTGERPLAGLRLLDLTHVIAGPVAARTLAAYGMDALRITAAHLPALPALDLDTGRGKRAAQLDLRDASDRATFLELVEGADVVLQSYRPGALAARGLGAPDLAARRPGLIYAELSAYGFSGPWAGRRGFDSLVQTATGFNAAEAEAAGEDRPRALPAQALDHGAGALLAFGIEAALLRRAVEGGSWRVRVSLAGVGGLLRGLGRPPEGFAVPDPSRADVARFLEETDSPFGRVSAVRHAVRLSDARVGWTRPPVALDAHRPIWNDG
ncbi:MAG: CoA transferase [Marivibrio sp.]|uniref:CoA transferase n=1 Tax=Marivibrio sp. TaxID=2039719 RepID=UPI0032EB950D